MQAEFWNVRREENRAYDLARFQAISEGREAPPARKMYRRIQELEEFHLKQGLRKLKLQKEAEEAAKAQPVAELDDDYEDDDDDD